MKEDAPKTKWQLLSEEMQSKGFNFAKQSSLFERRFNEDTQQFEDKTYNSVDDLKKEYETRYPDSEIEIITAEGGKNNYIFVKSKK